MIAIILIERISLFNFNYILLRDRKRIQHKNAKDTLFIGHEELGASFDSLIECIQET